MNFADEQGAHPRLDAENEAARKRAAVETYARHQGALRRTARRYSICEDDAEDALQRGLEILLRKAPSEDPRELIKWTQTVVKHEALAVRRERERILPRPAASAEPDAPDWVSLIPADSDGPPERAERREAIARSREALQALKPQELRALTLLAEGYSYAEIGEITQWSQTKINRCLAEGRERFRKLVSRSEEGSRCEDLKPLISSFCDGKTDAEGAATLREHLRACPHCRATVRAYRAAPAAAGALAPALPLHRSLLERAHDVAAGLAARVGGGVPTDSGLQQLAASGGGRGLGVAALAKVATICIGTAGGAAACVATGLVPMPLDLAHDGRQTAPRQSTLSQPAHRAHEAPVDYAPEAAPEPPSPAAEPEPQKDSAVAEPEPVAVEPEPGGAVEYVPPPEPAPAPVEAPSSSTTSGSVAGEFGP